MKLPAKQSRSTLEPRTCKARSPLSGFQRMFRLLTVVVLTLEGCGAKFPASLQPLTPRQLKQNYWQIFGLSRPRIWSKITGKYTASSVGDHDLDAKAP